MQIAFPARLWAVSQTPPCLPAAFASCLDPFLGCRALGGARSVWGQRRGASRGFAQGSRDEKPCTRGDGSVPQPGTLWVDLHFFQGKIIFLVVLKADDSHGRLTFGVYFSVFSIFVEKDGHLCWSEPSCTHAGVFS